MKVTVSSRLILLCIVAMFAASSGNLNARTPAIGELKKGKGTRNTQELFLILCENTNWMHQFSPRKQCDLGNATSTDGSVAEVSGMDGDAGGNVTITAGDAGKATLTFDLTQNSPNDINTDNSSPGQVTVRITIYVLVVPCDNYHKPTNAPVLPPAEDFPKPVEPAKEPTPTPTVTPTPKANKSGAGGDSAGEAKSSGNKPKPPTPTPKPAPPPNAPKGTTEKTGKANGDKTSGGSKLKTTNSPGVVTKTVSIMDNGELVGEVIANIPDNPDGTFTGTVEAKPAGKTEEQRSRNHAKLNEVVVTVGDQQAKPEDKTFTCTIPPETANEPLTVIVTYKQKEIARTSVPPQTPRPSQSPVGGMPWFGQTGHNVVIPHICDGKVTSNDTTKIGGETVPLIVETQQQRVVRDTSTAVGPTQMEIIEQGQTTTVPIQNMSVQLASDKSRLKQGEQTTLKATISGGSGLTQPLGLEVVNNSSSIVQLSGGTQHVIIQPSEVGAAGDCTKTFTLIGKQPGQFNIRATLEVPGQSGH